MRHAPGAAARVRAELVGGAVVLEIENDPAAARGMRSAGGHGLIGMRERSGMLGGTLVAGATAAGGYRVCATLPIATSTTSNDKELPLS